MNKEDIKAALINMGWVWLYFMWMSIALYLTFYIVSWFKDTDWPFVFKLMGSMTLALPLISSCVFLGGYIIMGRET